MTEFWECTPKELNALFKGYREQKQIDDEKMYTQGLYNKIAYEVVMSHFAAGFAGKKSKAKYVEKPFLQLAKDKTIKPTSAKCDRDKAVWDMWAQSCANSGLPPSPYN